MSIKHSIKFGLCALLIIAICRQPLLANSEALQITFIGDSLLAGYSIVEEKSFVRLVEQKLSQDYSFTVNINVDGISGSTSASALSRLTWQLRQKPNILFLALGANDGLRGLSHQAMKNNLSKTIELASQNNIIVILAGMKALPNYGKDYVKSFEDVFVSLKQQYDLILMPFLLADVAGNPELNLPDGIHPNEQGHQIIADNIYPFIQQAIAKVNQ